MNRIQYPPSHNKLRLKHSKQNLCKFVRLCIRHGHRSQKFLAATYVRNYIIYFTKKPKKVEKMPSLAIPTVLKFSTINFPYDQGQ